MSGFDSDDQHALLRAVIRLETKVDLMLEEQRQMRADFGGLDGRLRGVETKVAALEVDAKGRKNWPQVASGLASIAAILIALFK